ncbi:hypothetical protein AA313_de0202607 [Arthrobotrys entomopaga]|nr:hypothetical protein AA313_de0202607 [Arthrobotrys entomopaga]
MLYHVKSLNNFVFFSIPFLVFTLSLISRSEIFRNLFRSVFGVFILEDWFFLFVIKTFMKALKFFSGIFVYSPFPLRFSFATFLYFLFQLQPFTKKSWQVFLAFAFGVILISLLILFLMRY